MKDFFKTFEVQKDRILKLALYGCFLLQILKPMYLLSLNFVAR
jgi:hypothetical protein